MSIRYVHTNIISEDWERLAAFYQDVFQCIPVPPRRELSGVWLSEGAGVENASLRGMHLRLPGYGEEGPTLEIFQYEHMEERLPPAANRKGLGHLAFLVDDVAAVREAVLTQGGQDLGKISRTHLPGVGRLTFTYMTDPEGNILELQHWD